MAVIPWHVVADGGRWSAPRAPPASRPGRCAPAELPRHATASSSCFESGVAPARLWSYQTSELCLVVTILSIAYSITFQHGTALSRQRDCRLVRASFWSHHLVDGARRRASLSVAKPQNLADVEHALENGRPSCLWEMSNRRLWRS